MINIFKNANNNSQNKLINKICNKDKLTIKVKDIIVKQKMIKKSFA